jgi:uncharacterized protein YrrD
MYKVKDFSMMEVIDVSGKKIGFVKDLMIDFHKKKVIGFVISPYNLFIRSLTIFIEDIITFSEVMIVKSTEKEIYQLFKSFKDMDIIDKCGNMIGMLEDIIFDEKFNIRAIIMSSGMIRKLLEGKRIILINEIIVGEQNILFFNKSNICILRSMPHSLIGVECYEEV